MAGGWLATRRLAPPVSRNSSGAATGFPQFGGGEGVAAILPGLLHPFRGLREGGCGHAVWCRRFPAIRRGRPLVSRNSRGVGGSDARRERVVAVGALLV